MKLTTEEKAARYDSLMSVIPMTIERFEQEVKRLKAVKDDADMSKIDCLNYGHATGIERVIKNMRMWV